MNHISARGTGVCKILWQKGAWCTHKTKTRNTRSEGSVASLEREADIRKGEECGLPFPNGKGVDMQELFTATEIWENAS